MHKKYYSMMHLCEDILNLHSPPKCYKLKRRKSLHEHYRVGKTTTYPGGYCWDVEPSLLTAMSPYLSSYPEPDTSPIHDTLPRQGAFCTIREECITLGWCCWVSAPVLLSRAGSINPLALMLKACGVSITLIRIYKIWVNKKLFYTK